MRAMGGVAAGALASALMASEQRFQALAEISLQGKLVHRRFRPLFANTAFAYLCGWERAEDITERDDILCFLDDETRDDPERAWLRLLHGPAVYGRRAFRRRDGSVYTAEIYARAIDWDGEPAVAIAAIDVSHEEAARQALRDAQTLAEATAQAKRRFLSAASHELRAPLQGALGRLQVLAQNLREPKTEALARDALECCRDLSRRIEDVLDAAAIDARTFTLSREPFLLKAIVEEALREIRPAADLAQVRLAAPMVDAGARLMGDPRAVRRIIASMLEAGVRRLPSRAVSLEAQTDAAGVSISVRAEGALRGPPEDAPADPAAAFEPLCTARRMAAAHKGVLVEWGRNGQSWGASAFLPLERLDAAPQHAQPRGYEVLVVEDNAGARAFLKVALQTLGHNAHLAVSGDEAVAAVSARAFDLVLMDIAMPAVNGLEAARRIRALPVAHASLPIAALTAASTPELREQIAEAGMDAYLRKPIDVVQLAETIALLGGRSVQPAERDEVEREYHDQEPSDHRHSAHATLPASKMSAFP